MCIRDSSYAMLQETGEFVINLTTQKLAFATDLCGVKSGRDTDKWKEAHPVSYTHLDVYKRQAGYCMYLTDQPFIKKAIPSLLEAVKSEDGKVYAMPYSQNFMGCLLYTSYSAGVISGAASVIQLLLR